MKISEVLVLGAVFSRHENFCALLALLAIFYNIFTRHISSYSEAIYYLSQTLITYEFNNSVRKAESTNRGLPHPDYI